MTDLSAFIKSNKAAKSKADKVNLKVQQTITDPKTGQKSNQKANQSKKSDIHMLSKISLVKNAIPQEIPNIKVFKHEDEKPVESESDDSDTDELVICNRVNYTPDGQHVIYITRSGAFIDDYDKIETLNVRRIENYFTCCTETYTLEKKQLKTITINRTTKRIIAPRFGIFEVFNAKFGLAGYRTVSQITPGQPIAPVWTGRQTPNQTLITNWLTANIYNITRLAAGSTGCILNLEAGQGKSYVAAFLIGVFKQKTAIIMHSVSLLEQWARVINAVFGSTVTLGYYYGTRKIDGDIVLMIIDSACNMQFETDNGPVNSLVFYKQFGFIIYDECHLYATKSTLAGLKRAQAQYMLGLSATPDENTAGFDRLVWWELGPVITAAALPGYSGSSESYKANVHRVMYYGPPSHTRLIVNDYTGQLGHAETVNMLSDDIYRKMLVVNCILEGLAKNLYIFVFADRREYLNELRELLERKSCVETAACYTDKDFVRIVGGANLDELDSAEVHSRVIFTTYQYMGTGKSIVKMNGLVLAHSRKNKMRQFINRIFRLGSDATITREIWDICDVKTRIASQWRTRKEYYESKKYKIIERTVRYENIDTYLPPKIKPTAEIPQTNAPLLLENAERQEKNPDNYAAGVSKIPSINKAVEHQRHYDQQHYDQQHYDQRHYETQATQKNKPRDIPALKLQAIF
jgi:hypothetical protein